jgi:acyl-CoA hydrolase
MDPKPASASRSILVHWMGIADINNAGKVHGGVLLKLADEAAGLAAVRHCGSRVVTAGVDRVTFVVPIDQGELVTLTASVNAAWRSSMEVGVRVTAERPGITEPRHTNTAYFTMVAVDADLRPIEVPPLIAETADELRREREAQTRRRNRLAEREEIVHHRTAPDDLPLPAS